MPGAINAVTLPLGPSTSTVLPSTVYFTLAGNGIGFLPIRDIAYSLFGLRVPDLPFRQVLRLNPNPFHCSLKVFASLTNLTVHRMGQAEGVRLDGQSRPVLPDFAEDFAAYAFAAGLTSGHDALRGGHDGDSQSTLHA